MYFTLSLSLTNNSQSSSWSIAWMGGGALRCVCGRRHPGQLRLERCCGYGLLFIFSTTNNCKCTWHSLLCYQVIITSAVYLCQYTKNFGTGFQNFDFKIFNNFLKFYTWVLVSAAAELSKPTAVTNLTRVISIKAVCLLWTWWYYWWA